MDWNRNRTSPGGKLVHVSRLSTVNSISKANLSHESGLTNDGGDPDSPYFCPAECDTTLQTDDRWFFGVDQPLRSIEEMIDVYHWTVGRNCILELDLTPDRSGLIPASYAARYKQLGDFISSCYSNPVAAKTTHSSVDKGVYTLKFDYPTSIDRIVMMED